MLKNIINGLNHENQKAIARKALVVMLYSHFEGICKTIFGIYISQINSLGLTVSEANSSLGAASLDDMFFALRDPLKKCPEFRNSLPDDAALHRFSRDRNFVEVTKDLEKRSVILKHDRIADTESNLKPVVLKKILYRLGIDPAIAEPWEGVVHRLLRRRNDVAHGTARGGIDEEEYEKLEVAVRSVTDAIVIAIDDCIREKRYLRVTAA